MIPFSSCSHTGQQLGFGSTLCQPRSRRVGSIKRLVLAASPLLCQGCVHSGRLWLPAKNQPGLDSSLALNKYLKEGRVHKRYVTVHLLAFSRNLILPSSSSLE